MKPYQKLNLAKTSKVGHRDIKTLNVWIIYY